MIDQFVYVCENLREPVETMYFFFMSGLSPVLSDIIRHPITTVYMFRLLYRTIFHISPTRYLAIIPLLYGGL